MRSLLLQVLFPFELLGTGLELAEDLVPCSDEATVCVRKIKLKLFRNSYKGS